MKNFIIGVLSVLLIVALVGLYRTNALEHLYQSDTGSFNEHMEMMMNGNHQHKSMGNHSGQSCGGTNGGGCMMGGGAQMEGKMNMMANMPCHQMGGQWMGNCEKDESGNIIPPTAGENQMKGMNGSMKGAQGETFSESTEALPDIVPTELVKLKDGDTFEMTAEMVKQEVGNRIVKRLAYNRMIPGPIIEVEKNAEITIKFKNALNLPTTLHSHGIRIDEQFDGLPISMGGTQKEMQPGETFEYKIKFPDTGVFWYHPHVREDYTQEMGLYGNFSVTEDGYWNEVDREAFLVLDDFSENDPFYKDLTNKTLMGRFGNILLINNQENFQMNAKTGEKIRFYVTNTANTRTFDFAILNSKFDPCVLEGECEVIGWPEKLKIVGGDIGRVEKEFMAKNFIIAPAERYIFESQFNEAGTYNIMHRQKKIGEIIVSGKNVGAKNLSPLRKNLSDYALIRDNFQKFLDQKIDKKLRISIGMKGMGEMRMGMEHKDGKGNLMGGMPSDMDRKEKSLGGERHMDEEGGIEWEDGMAQMNKMSNNKMMEWMLIDETDPNNPKKNVDMNADWTFKKGDMVKVEIYNDPKSMHPMQHPIHFHGQRFVVLTRDGKPNDNLQWKDTVLLKNGEKIEILLEMSNPGKWIAHCHIAEHMHAGMMFNFEVKE